MKTRHSKSKSTHSDTKYEIVKLGVVYQIEPVDFILCWIKAAIHLEATQYETNLSHLS